MFGPDEIETRFTYHPPKEWQPELYEQIRGKGRELAAWLDDVLPECRETALAVTHLEQAIMWANAAVARRS